MLASFGIEFHDLHFLGHGAFIFAGGIEMTGASTGFEFDFIAHDFSFGVVVGLNGDALSAQIGQDNINALFVDSAKPGIG
jgi:hypothetical protein